MLSNLTALYTKLDMEYQQEYSGPYEDLSFRSDDVEVVASLKDDLIDGFGRPMVAVGDDSLLKLHIERLYDICRNIKYMDFLIDGKLSIVSKFLLRQGYKVRPYYTQIIDLRKPIEQLHLELRKSYKSLVNKTDGLKYDFNKFREAHKKYHGLTRSDKTWELQKEVLPICIVQNNNTGAMFYSGTTAYYASAAGDNNHACIWLGLCQLRDSGCLFVEMGEQVFYGDQKQVNISKFKRGFGGNTITRLIIEKENK